MAERSPRLDWLRACSIAKRRGEVDPTVPNLAEAYARCHGRHDWTAYVDPFDENRPFPIPN